MNHYLKQTKKFLEAAQGEFKEGKEKNDPIKIRDAAQNSNSSVSLSYIRSGRNLIINSRKSGGQSNDQGRRR